MTDPDRRRALDEITQFGQETGGYCPHLVTSLKGIQYCTLAEASAEALTGIDPMVLADVAWWRAECDGLRTELDRLRAERNEYRAGLRVGLNQLRAERDHLQALVNDLADCARTIFGPVPGKITPEATIHVRDGMLDRLDAATTREGQTDE